MSRSGISSQFGFVAESTYGTYVAPTKFVPIISESLELDIARIDAAGIRTGRGVLHSDDWYSGRRIVEGTVEMEAFDRTTALLFVHALGGIATTGVGPYTHTITPSATSQYGKSLTMQTGNPGSAATVHPFSYLGCKIKGLELSATAGELAKLSVDVVGRDMTTAQTLATASYTASLRAYTFIQGSATIAAGAVSCKGFTLSIANSFDTDRVFLGSDLMSEPIANDLQEITGTLDLEFENLTQYNRYTAGTTAAVVLTLTAGASNSITATLNCRFDKGTPNVGDRGVLGLSLPFKAVGSTDAAACTIVVINGDSAP